MENGQSSALFRRLDRATQELKESYDKLEEFVERKVQGDAKKLLSEWLKAEKDFHFDLNVTILEDENYRVKLVDLFSRLDGILQLNNELNSKVAYHLSVVKYYNDIIELVSEELIGNELEL